MKEIFRLQKMPVYNKDLDINLEFAASKSEPPDISAGDLVNIYVVDDAGNPIKYYATDQFEVFNPVDTPSDLSEV